MCSIIFIFSTFFILILPSDLAKDLKHFPGFVKLKTKITANNVYAQVLTFL